jgi:DNA mismatch repair protein MutS
MSTPLIKEYMDNVRGLREEFGEDVVVFMQVGSFYEIYEVDGIGGHAKMASAVLQIRLTRRKSKDLVSAEDPWMCGFPDYTLGKFITRMNDDGYTVAVYDQRSDNTKERVRRGVYSPSIRLDTEENVEADKRLFAVRIESYRCGLERVRPQRFLFSIVSTDMNTGVVQMMEYDTEDWLNGLRSLLVRFQPSEVLYQAIGIEESALPSDSGHHRVSSSATADEYLIHEAYEIPGNEDAVAFLALERHPSIVTIMAHLFQFIKKHDPCFMKKLHKPAWCAQSTTLDYNRDAYLEFNIMDICNRRRSYVDRKKQKTLFDILHHTKTVMGTRMLRERLRSPLLDHETIRGRIDCLASYSAVGEDEYKMATDALQTIPDLDWLLLRWTRDTASLRQVHTMIEGITGALALLRTSSIPHSIHLAPIEAFMADVAALWRLEAMELEDGQMFVTPSEHLRAEMDEHAKYRIALNEMDTTVNFANDGSFRLMDKDHLHFFQTTKKRWETVRSSELFKDFRANITASTCRIYSDALHTLSRRLRCTQDKIQRLVDDQFRQESRVLLHRHRTALSTFSHEIAALDMMLTCARFFREKGYTAPVLVEAKTSGIEATGLRHAILEAIDTDVLYVPHDVRLGQESMLVYGMNSSGKSTFLKSVGIAVWLAQCGFFVPAASMRITPFEALYTKIGSYDNLYLGHSTFIAEMNELHYILRKAVPRRTLVLCDELTAGTEVLSATGIVASTLETLQKQEVTHIITTHLHLLATLPEVTSNRCLRVCHFRVSSEKSGSLLIQDLRIRYDRTLRDGQGPETYGIEIADDMGLPKEFIARAHEIRDRVSGGATKTRRSRYNKKLWMDQCFRCGGRQQLHTHHITPQVVMTEEKVHDKNGLYNLIVLCHKCHEVVHHHTAPV